MRLSAVLAAALLLVCAAPCLRAQRRFEAGVFLDSLSVSQTGTDNFGVGGRFGYRARPTLAWEGELAYDYGINFHEAYRAITSGDTTQIETTSIGVTQGYFGPTLEPSRGRLRPFATLKGGFVDFRLSPSLVPYSAYLSPILGIRTSNVNASLYPAVGAEATLGPLGVRLEAGDAIYFNNGVRNNLRITFGPILRF